MLKTHSQERGNTSWLIIFRLHVSVSLPHNYVCNWHTASYLYCVCENVLPNCHGSSDWCNCFSRSDSRSHAYTHTDKYSLSLSHTAKCHHRGRWCALFAWLPLFLPNLNINMTHNKRWHLHWLKMAAYLQWFFTKSDRSSLYWHDTSLFFPSFAVNFKLLIHPTCWEKHPSLTVCSCPSMKDW